MIPLNIRQEMVVVLMLLPEAVVHWFRYFAPTLKLKVGLI
jgi:hypothetical protein